MILPPRGSQERLHLMERILSDTGAFCRVVLGMHTDRDPETGEALSEEGKGGVRSDGPHGETIRFLDDEDMKFGILCTSRFTYKSSKVTGFLCRKILANPNISILLCMDSTKRAAERVKVVRDILTDNPIIKELFGDVKGSPWTDSSFVTSLRTDQSLTTPTLYSASPQKGTAGGRPDLIVFDDIVTEENSRTENGLKRGRDFVENSLALRGRNTRYLMVCTPYDERDATHWAMDAGWKTMQLDAGVDVELEEDGTVTLSGEARWPNLPLDHLRAYLKNKKAIPGQSGGMSYEFFMSQFMLRVVKGMAVAFKPTHFHAEKWQESMRDLSGYLLCDTAPSGSDAGDLNVLLYVGMDERNHVHVLDAEVGFWRMYDFCDRYLKMLMKWQSKVCHRAEVWEEGHSFLAYMDHIVVRAREQRIRLNTKSEKRNHQTLRKDQRIGNLQVRFQASEIHVCDTVPRTWNTGTEIRSLWDPEGDLDADTKLWVPGGELVRQFVRWPHILRKDIPDCLSLVNAMDKQLRTLVCSWIRPARSGLPDEARRNAPTDTHGVSAMRPAGSQSRFYDKWSRRQ